MTEGDHTQRMVILTCGHTTYFSPPVPRKDDRVLCRRCNEYQRVRETRGQWHMTCRHHGCRVHRYYGANEWEACRAGARHSIRHQHIAVVFFGDTVRHTYDPAQSLPALPGLAEHGRSLRHVTQVTHNRVV